jgi:hypothetical protein
MDRRASPPATNRKANQRSALNGLCLAIIQSGREGGAIGIQASSAGSQVCRGEDWRGSSFGFEQEQTEKTEEKDLR